LGWSPAKTALFAGAGGLKSPPKNSDRLLGAALVALSLVVYLGDQRFIGCGDTAGTVLLARSIAFRGEVRLDASFPDPAAPLPYYARRHGDHVYSWFPVGSALLAVPAFVAARLLGSGGSPTLDGSVELLTASWVAALTVGVAYALLRQLASRRWSLVLALLFAFGTPNWSTSSMNLWQHGPGTLAILVAMWALIARPLSEEKSALIAGTAMGFATVVRPLNGLLAVALALHLFLRDRRASVAYVVGGLPWALLQVIYG
jgi:hypothetical protein